MKYFLTTLLSCTLLMTACSASSADNTHDIGKLRVSDVWAKATPPQARVAGGYLSVQNRGDAADKLLRVESARSHQWSGTASRLNHHAQARRLPPDVHRAEATLRGRTNHQGHVGIRESRQPAGGVRRAPTGGFRKQWA